jgi:hypothetical protein
MSYNKTRSWNATRRYSTLLDATLRCSTLLDAVRRCSTLLDAARRSSTLLDATRLGWQTWPADLAGRLGRSDLFVLKKEIWKLKANIVSCKNRFKTRVALLEPLDLNDIAVGNVGVPTCFYSNNIRIFILLNKLPILAQNLQNLLNLQKKSMLGIGSSS